MRALICGVSGQDGAYLAKLLLAKGYDVWGTSRDAQVASFANLERLGIRSKVNVISMAVNDFRSVLTTLSRSDPDELYFLAGQSSVGLSFEQPAETLESILMGTLNLLEAIRFRDKPVKFYHASSSECFGDVGKQAADEGTPFQPRSPYAVGKASAHWLVSNYREAYGLFACNGILFNHESPLRPARFVTRKIIAAACRIAQGDKEKLRLGRLDIVRDWGWSPEYVEAMWLILQQSVAEDFIIATGEAHSLEDFVSAAFDSVGLDWHDHVISERSLFRPTDIAWSQGNPAKAFSCLGWKSKVRMHELVSLMIKAESLN
ncbi:GDP-mannose 4,6-dehydratase [Methylomonas sp. SURF-2]|uniref:GDP-mannose 4,6-dehydratase n=1 Tax=Methylomonas subterranea TaxID=2952225 RepID=A0ABT1TJ39_9GAMM|nr:GDP-mannose 4,6-dehydratase [Methylomonas sp. SURF-2]MCQ8105486.1 GDP-mannose 4,6-dehydratase [Methylomonas sp. SURF-2]